MSTLRALQMLRLLTGTHSCLMCTSRLLLLLFVWNALDDTLPAWRVTGKTSSPGPAPCLGNGDAALIRVNPTPMKKTGMPLISLNNLPKRLMSASVDDRELMPKDLQERLSHALPADMSHPYFSRLSSS